MPPHRASPPAVRRAGALALGVLALALTLAAPGHAARAQEGADAIDTLDAGARMQRLRPDQIVRRGIDRLTGFLVGARDPSPDSIRTFIDHELAASFDFPYMARWAAGALHRRLDDEQKARFTEKLRELFLDALARNLGTFRRPLPRVTVYRARASQRGTEAGVPVRVRTEDGKQIRLEFRFYWSHEGWRIFDVSANRASAVAYYRRHFGELLRRRGPEALFE